MLTRFAPAPTGWLHLGHVVNALYVWGLARARGAQVLLRIEDHDRQRSRAEYERGILDDLDWLGFRPDVYPTAAFRSGACASRQQDREALYARHAATLVDQGVIYGCTCSRRDHASLELAEYRTGSGAPCPGRCSERGIEAAAGRTWRLRVPDEDEPFDDVLRGPQTGRANALGDIVVRDRRGNWSYQFAVTVDDLDQGVDFVVRGADLLESTGVQLHLARQLGRQVPARFGHHLLVMKTATQKLSKSDGDTGVRELAARGLSPAEVLGQAAHASRLISGFRPLTMPEALGLLS